MNFEGTEDSASLVCGLCRRTDERDRSCGSGETTARLLRRACGHRRPQEGGTDRGGNGA